MTNLLRALRVLFAVARKSLVSGLRGEYADFVISRAAFTLASTGTALILLRANGPRFAPGFAAASRGAPYLGYVLTGALFYAVTQGVFLNLSRSLMTELRLGTLEAGLIAPHSRAASYAGAQAAQLALTGIDLCLGLLLAALLGVELSLRPLELGAGLLLLWSSLFGLSVLTALLMIRLRDTFFIQNTILPLVLALGGYLFPIEALPPALRAPASLLPFHRALGLLRSGLLGGTEPGRWDLGLAGAAALALGSTLLGLALLPRAEAGAAERCLS